MMNKKGSTLIWAIAVITIISVVMGICYTIGLNNYNQSLKLNNKRQAYLTSKSLIEDLVKHYTGNVEGDPYFDLLPLKPTGSKISKSYLSFKELPDSLGIVENSMIERMSVKQSNEVVVDMITITITSKYVNATSTIKSDLYYNTKNSKWEFIKYYVVEEGKEIVIEKSIYDFGDRIVQTYLAGYNSIEGTYEQKKLAGMQKVYDEIVSGMLKNIQDSAKKNGDNTVYDKSYFMNVNHRLNEKWRSIIFYGLYGGSWPYLDTSQIKNEKYAKEFENYRVQVFFPYDYFCFPVVFGSSSNVLGSGWYTNLVYDIDGGHWYRLKNSTSINSFFETEKNAGTLDQAKKKWSIFRNEKLLNPDFATLLY